MCCGFKKERETCLRCIPISIGVKLISALMVIDALYTCILSIIGFKHYSDANLELEVKDKTPKDLLFYAVILKLFSSLLMVIFAF